MLRELGSTFAFWLGTRFVIYFADPDDAEIIINHPNTLDKGGIYKYVEDLIGGPGLISSGGSAYNFLMCVQEVVFSLCVKLYS